MASRRIRMSLHIRSKNRIRISRAVAIVMIVLLYVLIFVPDHGEDITLAPLWVSGMLSRGDAATGGVDGGATAADGGGIAAAGQAAGDGAVTETGQVAGDDVAGDDATAGGSATQDSGAVTETGDAAIDGGAIPFQYNRLFGYVSADGVIDTLLPVAYGVSYSDTYYSPYRSVNNPIPIYRRDGLISRVIDRYGYPVIDGERIIILDQNGSSASEWSPTEELWRRDFGTIISAVDSGPTLTAVAFFDGSVSLLDRAGNTVGIFADPDHGSRLLSAVALSADQRLSVAYEALRRQLLLFEIDGDTADTDRRPAPISDSAAAIASNSAFNTNLLSVIDTRARADGQYSFPYIAFLPISNNVIYFDGTTLSLYDVARSQLRPLHTDIELVDIDINERYVAAIVRTTAQTVLDVYLSNGAPLLRLPLADRSAVSDHFVRFSERDTLSLVIGIENSIIAIRQREES